MGEEEAPKLYGVFADYVREVLSEYSPDEYEICAMLWVQGESDGKVPEAAAGYRRIGLAKGGSPEPATPRSCS